jgi:hypothetical protein
MMRLRRQKFGRDGPPGRPSARWCVEERGIAFCAQERYREAIEHLSALPFQTRRSRLYQIAARMALRRN